MEICVGQSLCILLFYQIFAAPSIVGGNDLSLKSVTLFESGSVKADSFIDDKCKSCES